MEEAVTFTCNRNKLFGILHVAEQRRFQGVAVCIVSGGPQTRVGGHRLYTQMARFLCANGITVLRFDYEGMGDSEGELVRFEGAGPSIISAVDFIRQRFPFDIKIVIWSICDGCTISLMCAEQLHDRISGLVLCNPYLLEGEREVASAHLKYYYGRRIFKKAFWVNLLLLRINLWKEIKVVLDNLYKILVQKQSLPETQFFNNRLLLENMIFHKMLATSYPVWFIFSTEDMVGMRFRDLLNRQKRLRTNIRARLIKGADHTFTKSEMKNELFAITLEAANSISDSK